MLGNTASYMTTQRFCRGERAKTAFTISVIFFLCVVTFIQFRASTDDEFSDTTVAVRSQVITRRTRSERAVSANDEVAREQTDFFDSLLNLHRITSPITSHEAEIRPLHAESTSPPSNSKNAVRVLELDDKPWEKDGVVVVTPEPDTPESSAKLHFNSKHAVVSGHELLYAFFEQVVPRHLSGKLNVHIWLGICGTYVEQLRYSPLFPRFPFIRKFIDSFQSKFEASDFGQRIFGFIHPETSGTYQFAITSDDTSELWLSTDSNPKRSRLIAAVYSASGTAWTTSRNFRKYPIQVSRKFSLNGSRRYYVEALHKQGKGQSHVQVLWKRPLSHTFEVVGKEFLSLFVDDEEMHGEDSVVQDIDFSSFAPTGIPSHTRRKLDRGVKKYLYQC